MVEEGLRRMEKIKNTIFELNNNSSDNNNPMLNSEDDNNNVSQEENNKKQSCLREYFVEELRIVENVIKILFNVVKYGLLFYVFIIIIIIIILLLLFLFI
jgi:hypothetical protein